MLKLQLTENNYNLNTTAWSSSGKSRWARIQIISLIFWAIDSSPGFPERHEAPFHLYAARCHSKGYHRISLQFCTSPRLGFRILKYVEPHRFHLCGFTNRAIRAQAFHLSCPLKHSGWLFVSFSNWTGCTQLLNLFSGFLCAIYVPKHSLVCLNFDSEEPSE